MGKAFQSVTPEEDLSEVSLQDGFANVQLHLHGRQLQAALSKRLASITIAHVSTIAIAFTSNITFDNRYTAFNSNITCKYRIDITK